jgi:hypothetical protein
MSRRSCSGPCLACLQFLRKQDQSSPASSARGSVVGWARRRDVTWPVGPQRSQGLNAVPLIIDNYVVFISRWLVGQMAQLELRKGSRQEWVGTTVLRENFFWLIRPRLLAGVQDMSLVHWSFTSHNGGGRPFHAHLSSPVPLFLDGHKLEGAKLSRSQECSLQASIVGYDKH